MCPKNLHIGINFRQQNSNITKTSNVTSVTKVRSTSARLPVHGALWWVLLQRCDYFHRQVWYHVLSLPYACIRSSGVILIP